MEFLIKREFMQNINEQQYKVSDKDLQIEEIAPLKYNELASYVGLAENSPSFFVLSIIKSDEIDFPNYLQLSES